MNKTTFAELKTRAKNALKGKYWYCFGAFILVTIISGIFSTIATLIQGTNIETISVSRSLLSIFFTLLTSFFVLVPLMIGLTRLFIKATTEQPNIYNLFFPYKNKLGNIIITELLAGIYIFLWSLLLIVPGIIKSFEYSMIDFILAENPTITKKRAFEITKALTNGNKWRIFLFGLSFIGWILLSVLTLGIGFLFLSPYMQASYTQLYFDLKEEAITNGSITPEEFIYNEMI